MLTKSAQELLDKSMEKVAITIGNLGGKYTAWKVQVYTNEAGHNEVHVHIEAPDGTFYVYFPKTGTYQAATPPRKVQEAIKQFCSNQQNLSRINSLYNNTGDGRR